MSSLAGRSVWYFFAPIGSSLISLATLPIATQVVGAPEYGALAVAVAIAALVTAIATASIGYVIPQFYLTENDTNRSEIASSAVINVTIASLTAALILWPITAALVPHFLLVNNSTLLGINLCLLGAVAGSPWIVCSELLVLEGRARTFTVATIGQALTNNSVLLLFLYLYPHPNLALFAGNVAGQCLLTLVSIGAISGKLSKPKNTYWFSRMLSQSIPIGRASLAEAGRNLLERSYLGAWASVPTVGIYSHAQLYRNWTMQVLNAVSRATWPINLSEAQEKKPNFTQTYASWAIVQAGVTSVSLIFSLFGREIIDVLTSGQFIEAEPISVILISGLLIQTVGKPHMALLIAKGEGYLVSNASTIGVVTGVITMVILIPMFGAIGAASSIVINATVTRALIVYYSGKIMKLRFAEGWVIFGLTASAALYSWREVADPQMDTRATVAIGIILLIILKIRKSIIAFFKLRHHEKYHKNDKV